jgi:hypothetical protein
VTRYAPAWQQGSSQSAFGDRLLIAAAFNPGTQARTLWPSGQVTPVVNTMNCSVAPGTCIVPLAGGNGAVVCTWDAAEIVTVPTAHPTLNRQDSVILQVRDGSIDGGPNYDFIFTTVSGVPGGGYANAPVYPNNCCPMGLYLQSAGGVNLNGTAYVDQRVPPATQNLWGRCYQTPGTFTTLTAGFTMVPCGTADFLSPGFSVNGSGQLVVPITGRYDIEVGLGTINAGGNAIPGGSGLFQIDIRTGDTNYAGGLIYRTTHNNGNALFPNGQVSVKGVSLSAGDWLGMAVGQNAGTLYCDPASGSQVPSWITAVYVAP